MITFVFVGLLSFIYCIYQAFKTNNYIKVLGNRKLPFDLPEIQDIPEFLRRNQMKEKVYIIDFEIIEKEDYLRIEDTQKLVEKINKFDEDFGYEILKTITSDEPKKLLYIYEDIYVDNIPPRPFLGHNWCQMFAYDDEEDVLFYAFFKVLTNRDFYLPSRTQKEIKRMIEAQEYCYNEND